MNNNNDNDLFQSMLKDINTQEIKTENKQEVKPEDIKLDFLSTPTPQPTPQQNNTEQKTYSFDDFLSGMGDADINAVSGFDELTDGKYVVKINKWERETNSWGVDQISLIVSFPGQEILEKNFGNKYISFSVGGENVTKKKIDFSMKSLKRAIIKFLKIEEENFPKPMTGSILKDMLDAMVGKEGSVTVKTAPKQNNPQEKYISYYF